jgi:hypothetical protein
MRRKSFAYSLILLLFSAIVDDMWLLDATSKRAEASPASEDNEYLVSESDYQLCIHRTKDLPALSKDCRPRISSLLNSILEGRLAVMNTCSSYGTDRLFILMSIQC